MTIPKRKRRIMRAFKINEISAVDRPAQAHARVCLLKREGDLSKIAAFDSFDDAVAAIAKREGCARHAAMSRAAKQFPSLLDAYPQEGDDRVAKATADAAGPRTFSKAELDFEDRVDEIAKSRGLPRHAAMSAARQRFPDEFAAAYGREP